ncbi:ABC transporter substrate-binding protein [Gryllotalpicola koreensis]|uniref:Sugar ABC transporter substrate-binding protein n=1 Tax=Gryllotalpicola koreensis TaxID=993086 RepID=A0ABP8A018_9MICO
MMLRRYVALGAALATVAVLAGCSSGGSTGSAAGKGSATSGSITYEYFNNQPAAITATKKIVADFEKKYPKIHVKLEVAPADSLEQKLQTQYAGGVAPDVIQNDAPGDTLQFADFLADLGKLLPKSVVDDIPSSVRSGLTQDGKLLAVPTEQQSYVVFANKKILQDDGVTIPTGDTMSWDDFESIAKQTTTNGVKGLALGLAQPTSEFASFGLGFGAKFFTSSDESKAKASIGAAELQVPRRIKAMIDAGYVDKTSVTQSTSDALPTFYGGKAAMTIAGSYQIANIESQAPAGFDWIVLPALAGSTGSQQMSAPITLSITAKSKNTAAAATFVEFYQSAANLAAINIADGEIPATISALAEARKLTAGKNGWAEVLSSGTNLVNPTWNTFTKYEDWKSTVATPAYQKYLAGQLDDSGLASALEKGWTSVNQ